MQNHNYFFTNLILTYSKRPWCWERLNAGEEGDDRGWASWMASPTQWIWVWVNSGNWWWTGRSGMLQFMGLQKVRHDWETNWTELNTFSVKGVSSFVQDRERLLADIPGPGDKFWSPLNQLFECQVHESRQIGSDQTGDGKSEHQHSRNQWNKMDWNGWI